MCNYWWFVLVQRKIFKWVLELGTTPTVLTQWCLERILGNMLQSATAELCGTFHSWPGNVSSQLVHLGSLQKMTLRVSYSFEIERRCPFHAYFLEKWLIAVSHIFPSHMGVGAVQLCLKILVNQSTILTWSGHQAIAFNFNFNPSGRTILDIYCL